jgi:hypothetical protein
MIAFAIFDSRILSTLQDAVDHAWLSVPLEHRSSQIKDRVAKEVMRSAAAGERDPGRLNAVAVAASLSEPVDAYDIEIRRGDDTLASLRSVELPHLGAVWGHIAELANKVYSPDCRVRVMDPSGDMIISVGIATARLLRPT